jgi:hypothetical protein
LGSAWLWKNKCEILKYIYQGIHFCNGECGINLGHFLVRKSTKDVHNE